MTSDPAARKSEEAPLQERPVLLESHEQGTAAAPARQVAEVALDGATVRELISLRRAEQRDRRLSRILSAPDVFSSANEARRALNLDVPDLDAVSLWQHLKRCELRLALEGRPNAWLVARARACRDELARRREADAGRGVRGSR